MKIRQYDLFNRSQTAKEMYRLIDKYWTDLKRFSVTVNKKPIALTELTMQQFFDFVRRIPYQRDMKPIEVIARPKHLLKQAMAGLDCKKKSILIGSYLRGNNFNYRLIGSSNKKNKNIHHVFPQVLTRAGWQNLDATYKQYKPFQKKRVTAYEVL